MRGSPPGPSGAEPTSSRSCFRDLAYPPLESEPVPRAAMGKGGGDLFGKDDLREHFGPGVGQVNCEGVSNVATCS